MDQNFNGIIYYMHYFEIEKKETTLRSRANIAKAIDFTGTELIQ